MKADLHSILADWRVILPAEHGSWALLLMPFLVGAGVSPRIGYRTLLALIAVLSVFFARQPLALLIRIIRGKAPKSRRPSALFWCALLLGIAALAGIALLFLGYTAFIQIGLIAAVILSITSIMAVLLGPRRVETELIGTAGLALSAPMAYISGDGESSVVAGLVWLVAMLYSSLSVLYVRFVIDIRHDRVSAWQGWLVVGMHLLSAGAAIFGALRGWFPPALPLLLIGLLLRTSYVALRRPILQRVTRFGFMEMAVALVYGIVMIASLPSVMT